MDESDELDLFPNKTNTPEIPQTKILKAQKSPQMICIFGPRACGKNTLCKHLLAESAEKNTWIFVFSNDMQIDEDKHQISHPLLQYRLSQSVLLGPNADFWEKLDRILDTQILINETLIKNSDETLIKNSDETLVKNSDETLIKNSDETLVKNSDETSKDKPDETSKDKPDETSEDKPDETSKDKPDETSKDKPDKTSKDASEQAKKRTSWIVIDEFTGFDNDWFKLHQYLKQAQNYINFIFLAHSANEFNSKLGKYNQYDRHTLEVKYTKIYQRGTSTARPPKYNGLMFTTPQQYSEIVHAVGTNGFIMIENGKLSGELLPNDVKIINGPVIDPTFAEHLDKFLRK